MKLSDPAYDTDWVTLEDYKEKMVCLIRQREGEIDSLQKEDLSQDRKKRLISAIRKDVAILQRLHKANGWGAVNEILYPQE